MKGFRTHIIRGEIKLPEIKTFLGALYDSGGFDPEIHALWDAREAGFPEVTPAEIKELASFVRIQWTQKHRHKTAVVVTGDFLFGLSRMLEQFVGPIAHGKIRTFRELQPALDWLEGKASDSPHPTEG